MNKVPGTNTNSNRTVGTQQVSRKVEVENKTPKTRQEGEFRNWKHRRQTNTTADQEYAEKRARETAPQRTWRSDAADVLHLVGEAAMASTPITATSYFGAKALNDVIHGNANAGTALDVAFAAAPWMKPLRAASVTTTMDQLEGAKDVILDNISYIYDPYTSFGARFGYYGNPLERFYGTMARRFNLPDKARLPEFIRKSKDDIQLNNNEVLIGRPYSHHRSNEKQFKDITNLTYDRPVISHSAGNWDKSKTTFIINPETTLKRGTFGSIEPSDAFLIDNGHLTIPKKDVTIISGDINTLKQAKQLGIKTLSSRRARNLYKNEQEKVLAADNFRIKAIDNAIKNNADKYTIWGLKIQRPYGGDFSRYSQEIEKLQGLRGRPFFKDVKLLEESTGLSAGVQSISARIPFLNQMYTFLKSPFKNEAPYYPNGRQFEKGDPVNVGEYKHIFYDPSTHAEAHYRKLMK